MNSSAADISYGAISNHFDILFDEQGLDVRRYFSIDIIDAEQTMRFLFDENHSRTT